MLQLVNRILRMLCNCVISKNSKICCYNENTKTKQMEAIHEKLLGIATAAVFGLGILRVLLKAETIVTTDVLNVRKTQM